MEIQDRNGTYHRSPAKPPSLRTSLEQFRGITCVKCRKRKPGTPKIRQHCPSCLCPSKVVRSASGRLRSSGDTEDLLARFEALPRNSKEDPGQSEEAKEAEIRGRINSGARKSSSLNRQPRKEDQDPLLDALYRDIVGSGLADEETQGCQPRLRTPIRSSRRKVNLREEVGHRQGSSRNQEVTGVEDDPLLGYGRDYESSTRAEVNGPLEEKDIRQQEEGLRREETRITAREDHSKGEEERKQLERDKRELNSLGQEVREFEIKKEREKKREKVEEARSSTGTERRVSFSTNDPYETRNLRSPEEMTEIFSKSKTESRSNADEGHVERAEEMRKSFFRDNREARSREPYGYTEPRTNRGNKTGEGYETRANTSRDQRGTRPLVAGSYKKYIHPEGDLDLHASKSYIVDLIDRALSRELFTPPIEPKVEKSPSYSEKETCREITRTLQGDGTSSRSGSNTMVRGEAPEYVKHLKVLRWDYLNHIQDELRKLQDLERILDAYSPRESSASLHSQTSSNELKKDEQRVV